MGAEIDDIPVHACETNVLSHRRVVGHPIRRIEAAKLSRAARAESGDPGANGDIENDLRPDESAPPTKVVLVEEGMVLHKPVRLINECGAAIAVARVMPEELAEEC